MAPVAQQQQSGGGVVGSTTRWCPTPEQLMILEEMYRGGLRTPNAAQIQQITAHLACYGRIEGKNVFYWFQNHKARDRQKLRRRLCMSHHLLSCAHYYAAAHHPHLFAAPLSPLAAAPPLMPHYGALDQPSTTTPSAAAAAAAAAAAYATSFYYPFGAAAPPARSPTTSLFQHNQGGVSLSLPAAEAAMIGRAEHSLGKLVDNFGVALESSFPTAAATVVDTAAGAGYCRPLKTLDLFPGGLKEEQQQQQQQHDVV